MSDVIYIDRDNMERRMGDVMGYVDGLDAALGDIPAPADGGPASALIGFIAAAGAEAANEVSGAVRLIGAITSDVLSDTMAADEEIAEELSDVEDELEG